MIADVASLQVMTQSIGKRKLGTAGERIQMTYVERTLLRPHDHPHHSSRP